MSRGSAGCSKRKLTWAGCGIWPCAAAASALELAEDVLKQVEQWFAATEDPQADTKGPTMG